MANTKSANDFNRLQAELFYKQTTSTSRKRRNKPSTPTTVTTKTTILVSNILLTSSNNQIFEFRIPNIYNKILVLIFLMILRTQFEASLRFRKN